LASVIEHQPRQRRHDFPARRLRQSLPVRLLRSDSSRGVEEIELTQFRASALATRRLSWRHGLLRSDSDRENPWMRPNARRSMPWLPAVRAPARRSTGRAASPAPLYRRQATPTSSPNRRWRDRTSRPAGPARDRRHPHRSSSGKCPRSPAPSPRALAPGARTKDERDTTPRVRRVHGRYVVELYNAVRPHSSLSYRPSAPETIVPNSESIVPCGRARLLSGPRPRPPQPWRQKSPCTNIETGSPLGGRPVTMSQGICYILYRKRFVDI